MKFSRHCVPLGLLFASLASLAWASSTSSDSIEGGIDVRESDVEGNSSEHTGSKTPSVSSWEESINELADDLERKLFINVSYNRKKAVLRNTGKYKLQRRDRRGLKHKQFSKLEKTHKSSPSPISTGK